MKYSGLYLLIYNAICLLVLKTDWYSELITMYIPLKGFVTSPRYEFINLFDVPFYVIGYAYLIYKRYDLSLMQMTYFIASFLYLCLCWSNAKYEFLGMESFLFFAWFIISAFPLAVFLGANFNFDRFKK